MPTPTDLLRDDDPAPVRTLRDTGRSDFLLTADHAGRAIPSSLNRLGVSESELDRHIAWDIGIAGVTERLSAALDATAVLQTYSRLVIDCNRDPSVASSIPEVSEATNIPGNLGLSAPARAARRQAVFEPYHARIRALLDARQAVSVTERQRFILRVRTLARGVAEAYRASREALGFPLIKSTAAERAA